MASSTTIGKIEAWLSNIAGVHGLLRDAKLAAFGLNRSINHAGALLLVSGALAIASGIIFLSGERANSSNAESAFLSGKGAGSSRTSPIVWVYEQRPSWSINFCHAKTCRGYLD